MLQINANNANSDQMCHIVSYSCPQMCKWMLLQWPYYDTHTQTQTRSSRYSAAVSRQSCNAVVHIKLRPQFTAATWRVSLSTRRPRRVSNFYRAMLCISGTSHGPVSVCLSVTSRSSTKTAERTELVFGMWASFHPSYIVLKWNSVISKNNGTSLWNFVLKSGLRKFRYGKSIVETCYQLSSRKVDAQSVINWAVVGQLSR